MKRDAVLNTRIPGDVKEAVARAADAADRSTSSMVIAILREWCVANGYLKPLPAPKPPKARG